MRDTQYEMLDKKISGIIVEKAHSAPPGDCQDQGAQPRSYHVSGIQYPVSSIGVRAPLLA
jgi:hypothetical protein